MCITFAFGAFSFPTVFSLSRIGRSVARTWFRSSSWYSHSSRRKIKIIPSEDYLQKSLALPLSRAIGGHHWWEVGGNYFVAPCTLKKIKGRNSVGSWPHPVRLKTLRATASIRKFRSNPYFLPPPRGQAKGEHVVSVLHFPLFADSSYTEREKERASFLCFFCFVRSSLLTSSAFDRISVSNYIQRGNPLSLLKSSLGELWC